METIGGSEKLDVSIRYFRTTNRLHSTSIYDVLCSIYCEGRCIRPAQLLCLRGAERLFPVAIGRLRP